ncbi:hypothetical protein ACOZB2_32320 [Pantoea endophytica]|uniref:Uncharacterized protein n=1 Tax=Pantoea sp. BJ2 TaxID=3141322 RepID=A0AAU7TR92_9GAMM
MPFKWKLVIGVAAFALGIYIPTQMLGFTIHNAFFAKQQLNCLEDTSLAAVKMVDDFEMAGREMKTNDVLAGLKTCVNNLDYNKGLMTSVREEIAREKSVHHP